MRQVVVACLFAWSSWWGIAAAAPAQTQTVPLEGPGASIAYFGAAEADLFKPGAVLFTDRSYVVRECPQWLEGKKFVRGSIDSSALRVTGDGVLTLLTMMLLTGMFVANFVGQWWLRQWHRVMSNIPIVKSIYSSV